MLDGHRRALEMLAGLGNGCTEALMRSHGIKRDVIAKMILDGPAIAAIERREVGRGAENLRRRGGSRLN